MARSWSVDGVGSDELSTPGVAAGRMPRYVSLQSVASPGLVVAMLMTKLGCSLPEADPMMLGSMPDKSIP
jgi:hypothetical protein